MILDKGFRPVYTFCNLSSLKIYKKNFRADPVCIGLQQKQKGGTLMKPFLDKDFLLSGEIAPTLYHAYAEPMPIIDYHCHIPPKEIAENRSFQNLTEAWLEADHYKWRLMRSNGVPERLITGDASPFEKFQAFAQLMPKAIGNPMYHWVHLELRRYFQCQIPLSGETAQAVWDHANALLPTLRVRDMIRLSNVRVIITTDDPADSLEYHRALRDDPFCQGEKGVRVLPGFRPDKAVNIEKDGFPQYMETLENVWGQPIETVEDLNTCLSQRMDLFQSLGCKASDHGVDQVPFAPASPETVEAIFRKRRNGEPVSPLEAEQYQTALLLFLAEEYTRRGWVMELHYGVIRNTNAQAFRQLGPDTGFDCIRDIGSGRRLPLLLDRLAAENHLPKMVLFSLHPGDNEFLASLMGAFQGTEFPGKLQHGPAWWFNDSKSGMQAQLQSLANLSLLGNFIGMLTDSRSFLSYTRHEYFRRILCQYLGTLAENGEYPADFRLLGKLVQDICFRNAMHYFGLEE